MTFENDKDENCTKKYFSICAMFKFKPTVVHCFCLIYCWFVDPNGKDLS